MLLSLGRFTARTVAGPFLRLLASLTSCLPVKMEL